MSDNLSTDEMREQDANKLIWRNDAKSENYEAATATGAYYWVKCIFDFSSDKNGKSLGYSIKYCPTDDDKDDRVIKDGVATVEEAKAIAQQDYNRC